MIIDHEVEVKWHGYTRNHYEKLGYKYTKKDDIFTVKSTELSKGSNIVVRYICDYCGKECAKKYLNIMTNRANVKKDCCKDCAPKKHLESKLISGSLASEYPEIAQQWDNTNNEHPPTKVTPYSKTKAHWICEKGHKWEARVYSRTVEHASGCPICGETKGERIVAEALEASGVNFEREYQFRGLVGTRGGALRFDFAILNEQGNVRKLIEYDGPYHFHKLYEGDGHELLVKHDHIKNEFCKRKAIPLLRIKYTEFDKAWLVAYRFATEDIVT